MRRVTPSTLHVPNILQLLARHNSVIGNVQSDLGHVLKALSANLVLSLVTMFVVRTACEKRIVNTSFKRFKTEYSNKLFRYCLIPELLANLTANLVV